ncbi:MAG: hypothetical protein ACXW0G_05975 [Methylosarcina sp.]
MYRIIPIALTSALVLSHPIPCAAGEEMFAGDIFSRTKLTVRAAGVGSGRPKDNLGIGAYALGTSNEPVLNRLGFRTKPVSRHFTMPP